MLAPLWMWILAVSLSQSPAPVAADTGWLKAIPADVDAAVRVRGMDTTCQHLMAMLKVMSPGLAERAEQALAAPLAQFWNDVKAQVDTFLKGDAGIGSIAGYKSVRSRLPDQSSFLMLASVQALVQMMATQFAVTFNKPDLKAPADLPREPVFLGGSITKRPPAVFEFHFVLPSQVGPIFQKGLAPLFQGIQGQGQP